jgi:hypothetical protein
MQIRILRKYLQVHITRESGAESRSCHGHGRLDVEKRIENIPVSGLRGRPDLRFIPFSGH